MYVENPKTKFITLAILIILRLGKVIKVARHPFEAVQLAAIVRPNDTIGQGILP